MRELYEIEGNEYLNPSIGERFVVKRVENWSIGPVAIMEYEDGVPHDEPAEWVRNNCELLEENASPVDLMFYNDEGIMSKAHKMGMDFAENLRGSLPNQEMDMARFFRDKVKENQVENEKGRTFTQELERFVNSGVSREDVVEKAWTGFAEFAVEIDDVEPVKNEERKRVNQIALE
jgi:hypothetical protein